MAEVIAAVRRATDLPLTVKIRSGWDAQSINCLQIANIAVAEGVDAITLHPRTRAQGFSGRADWEWIRRLKDTVPVPVIGSGDILTVDDALAMFAQTGCDAIMIGRGGYGNPWLIRDIVARLAGGWTAPPAPAERQKTAELHLELFLETFPARKAVRDLRKHFAWYSRGLPGAAQFRTQINRLDSVEEMRAAATAFFASMANAA